MASKTAKGGTTGVVDSLRQLFQRGDYDGVVQRAEQFLKRKRSGGVGGASPRDGSSLIAEGALIAALIHLGRGAEAEARFEILAQLPDAEKKMGEFLSYARPYLAWAGVGSVADALEDVKKREGDDARKLEAQLLYRLGRYFESAAVYEDLSKRTNQKLKEKQTKKPTVSRWAFGSSTPASPPVTAAELDGLRQSASELATNLMATLVLSGRHSDALEVKDSTGSTYELEYNATCASIGASDLGLADICLEKAEQLMLAEGEEDEDLDADMAPVRVQRAYLKHLGGDVVEARDTYDDIVRNKSADPASLAVAANNLTVALGQLAFDTQIRELEERKAQSGLLTGSETEGGGAPKVESETKAERLRHAALGEGLKKMRATAGTKVQGKLTDVQRRAMARNRAILLVQMGRLDGCKQEVDRLKTAYPDDPVNPLIEAALLARRGNLEAADAVLCGAGDSPAIHAARIQLAENHGDRKRAADLLVELFPDQPAAVATAANIFEELGEHRRALQLLQDAAKDSVQSIDAKRALAGLLMRMESYQEAASVLQEVLDVDQSDAIVRAELAVALSYFDAAKAEDIAQSLPPPAIRAGAGGPQDLAMTGAELEALPPPKRRGGGMKPVVRAEGGTQEQGEKHKKKHKKRKKRLPKNYDPDGPPPDPERWLPKSMRAGYKKKNKKKSDGVFRGSQGAGAAEAEAAAAKNAERSAAKARAAEEAQAPSTNRPKGAKPKKKKRKN